MRTYNIFLDGSTLDEYSDPSVYLKNHPRCRIVDTSREADISFIDPFVENVPYQSRWVNRVKYIESLTHKEKLARLIRKTRYTPKTWIVLRNRLPDSLLRYREKYLNNLLVCKPIRGSLGKGISFIHCKSIEKELRESKKKIVQEYVYPYLIDSTKFDCRMYVFIDHHRNFRLSKHGVIRFAYTQYSLDTTNPETHITNTSFSPNSTRFMSFQDWNEAGRFFPKIYDAVKSVIKRFNKAHPSKPRGIHLLGFDIAIGIKGDVKVLEINRRPCLFPIDPLQFKTKKDMMDEYVEFWDTVLD